MQSHSWSIRRLELANYRLYEELTMHFEEDLTVLVGQNGAGKTAVLDALAVALGTVLAGFQQKAPGISKTDARKTTAVGGTSQVSSSESHYPVSITVAGSLNGAPHSWSRVLGSESGRTTWGDGGVRNSVADLADRAATEVQAPVVLPVIAYYGIERLVGVQKLTSLMMGSRLSAYENALVPKSDMHRLATYVSLLAESAFQEHARDGETESMAMRQLKAIRMACDNAIQDVGWCKMRWDPILKEITFLSQEDNVRLPLSSLSSGIRITAGLVIDIASRMGRANPTLGGEKLLSDTPGIVIIDEVDLHLHPSWQQRIVGMLRRTFPRVQFIVSTHSPQVLSSLEASSIRVLRDDGVEIPRYSEGIRPDIILETIQGTNPTPETENRRMLRKYLAMVDQGDGRQPEAKMLRKQIDEQMGGVANVPELADADALMVFSE